MSKPTCRALGTFPHEKTLALLNTWGTKAHFLLSECQ